MRSLIRIPLAVGLGLTIGVTAATADTITFDNSSLHPDGSFSIGTTVSLNNGVVDAVAHDVPLFGFNVTGTCGTAGTFGCLNLTTGTFLGPVLATTANDFAYNGGGSVTVTGGIASLSLPDNTVLFSGSFDPTANVILQFDDDCVTTPAQCTGSLTGTLAPGTFNPVLAAAFGVNPNSLGGDDQSLFLSFAGLSMPLAGEPVGTAGGNTNQLEVVTPGVAAVPEPTTMVLMGSGLLVLARGLRRTRG